MLRIITKSGRVLLKSACTLINNEWYEVGNRNKFESGEVYQIGAKFNFANELYWNANKKRYYRLTENIAYGYSKTFNNLCHFKKTKYTVKIDRHKELFLEDYRDFPTMNYNGRYNIFMEGEPSAYVVNYADYNTRLYGADDNIMFDKAWSGYQTKPKVAVAGENVPKVNIVPELFDYSFGVEFETSSGSLHSTMLEDSFLVPVRDGSIDGYEYISVPMQNELDTLKTQCHYLSRQCNVDKKTSTHIHLGNLPRTKEFALSFYILMYRFQNEINAMFPPLKKLLRSLDDHGNKEAKDYCKFLPELNLMYGRHYIDRNGEIDQDELDEGYRDLWTFWNDGEAPSENHNPQNRIHRKAHLAKWNYVNRYSIVNMNNYFFTNSRTIEFRYHEGTVNFGKISNWILLNVAFVKFAENHAKEILSSNTKITFKDILSELGNESLETHLSDYIYERKTEMSRHYSAQNPFYQIYDLDKTKECTWQNLK